MLDERQALEKVLVCEKLMLTPDDVAPLLGTTANTLRKTAKNTPQLLGFPFTYCGSNMKIPKQPFLEFIGVGGKR